MTLACFTCDISNDSVFTLDVGLLYCTSVYWMNVTYDAYVSKALYAGMLLNILLQHCKFKVLSRTLK